MDKHPDYYEGILQLRDASKEVVDFVRNQVEQRRNVWIAKEKRVGNGIDFYFSSQRYLRALGKKLKTKFNGELKESRKLHTQSHLTSKRVYRVNVFFRLLPFKKGDIITHRGDKIKIKSTGKLISGVEVKTGKKVSFKAEEL